MKIIVVRHGQAVPRERWDENGKPEQERPLTSKGERRMKKVARRIHDIAPEVTAVIASPYARCVKSAEILCAQFKGATPAFHDGLEPGADISRALDALALADAETIVIIGHEPNLSQLTTALLLGRATTRTSSLIGPLKKGGFAVLEIEGEPGKGHASLKLLAEGRRR